MDGSQKFLRGFLKISISGDQIERFLNLCHARAIPLENVFHQSENSITAYISVNNFRKLTPIHRKTRVHIHILQKRGLPFWMYKSKKRKCFIIGIIFCASLLFWLSGHIWNIHIDGNVANSTPQLLEFLDQQGIIHGISRKKANCSQIASLLRKKYPDITFVSARVQGTCLFLSIQEETLTEDIQKSESPCDLISDLDGEIVNIVIRSGTQQVRIGDNCKKGDVLVTGEVPILNDGQELVRTKYVSADADIYVRHQTSYYKEIPLLYEKRVQSGMPKTNWYFHTGNWIFGAGTGTENQCLVSVEEIPWRLTENFVLPFSLGKIIRVPYEIQEAVYTKDEAEQKLMVQLKSYKKNLLEKGSKIENCSLSVVMEENSCIMKGTLTLVEKCGVKSLRNPL